MALPAGRLVPASHRLRRVGTQSLGSAPDKRDGASGRERQTPPARLCRSLPVGFSGLGDIRHGYVLSDIARAVGPLSPLPICGLINPRRSLKLDVKLVDDHLAKGRR